MSDYLADREGLYAFMHKALSHAVRERYLACDADEKMFREKIIQYFELEKVTPRQVEELPYALYIGKHDELLAKYLQQADQTVPLCQRSTNEFVTYWKVAIHGGCAAQNLVKSLCAYQDDLDLLLDERAEQNILVATALLLSDEVDYSLRLFAAIKYWHVSSALKAKGIRGVLRVNLKQILSGLQECSEASIKSCLQTLIELFELNHEEPSSSQAYDRLLYVEFVKLFIKYQVDIDFDSALNAVKSAMQLFSESSDNSYSSSEGIAQALVIRLDLFQEKIAQCQKQPEYRNELLNSAFVYLNDAKKFIEKNLPEAHPQNFMLQSVEHVLKSQHATSLKSDVERLTAWKQACCAAQVLYQMMEKFPYVFIGNQHDFLLLSALETISIAYVNGVSIAQADVELIRNITNPELLSSSASTEIRGLSSEIYQRMR